MGRFIRDNIEAFAVAIAMALVIRHYCIEAFRIPTHSMKPTLYGDHVGADRTRRHGDRILVDKFVYQRRDPRRYEVIVFRYPLNGNINFIKRLVGLPGERVRVEDGDLWISRDGGETWTIARKPPGARDEMLDQYYPVPFGAPGSFANTTVWAPAPEWRVDEDARRFTVDAAGLAELHFRPKVMPYPSWPALGATSQEVGDVRVRFGLEVQRAGVLEVVLREHGQNHRLVLGPEKSFCVCERAGEETVFPLEFEVRDGDAFDVSFANVDDTLVVSLDGEEHVFPYPDPPREPPHADDYGNRVALRANGLAAVVTDIAVDRDVMYRASQDGTSEWDVPPGRYLVMGDNTGSSADSREWTVARVQLESGEVIEWEPFDERRTVGNPPASRPPLLDPDTVYRVEADVHGHVRRFRAGEVVSWETVDRPFVPRENLIGRAFSVFWPIYIPPIYRGPTRVKLIR